jgi:beta-glucosidase
MAPRRFPPGFLWGTATAAHQVEGQNDNNQWWDWEQQPERIWHGDRSGDACGWWRDPAPDLDRIAALGQNAHRLSIEWSRIEPRDGAFDEAALERYRELLVALRQRGITPMVTLHHFTNPRWLEQLGGWLHPDTPLRFARFVARTVERLGDQCQLWCTINEPMVYVTQSYLLGLWPPGAASIGMAFHAAAAMLRGHAAASAAIRAVDPSLRVGIVHNLRLFDPATPAPQDIAVAMAQDYLFNGVLLMALRTGHLPPPLGDALRDVPGLRGSCDFFGLNYYTRDHVAFDPRVPQELFGRRFTPAGAPQSDAGRDGHSYGEIYPAGLYRALRRVARLGLPIYITETGLPDADDDQRPQYILDHLAAVHQAIGEGVDVRGVFLWTLVDNFEWSEGWGLRFGLYALDQPSGTRTLRPSGALYAAIARANAIPGRRDWRLEIVEPHRKQ